MLTWRIVQTRTQPKRPRKSTTLDQVNWDEQSESSGDEATRRVDADDSENEMDKETAEERRVRMAKDMLSKLGDLQELAGSDGEDGGSDSDDSDVIGGARDQQQNALDPVSQRLHQDLLGSKGRLRRSLAERLDCDQIVTETCARGHRFAITCVALSSAEDFCFTGSKDCCVVRWDVETGKKLARYTGKPLGPGEEPGDPKTAGHTDQVLALSLSSDGRFLASGSRDRTVKIWDVRTDALVETFKGHRDTVSGVAFQHGTHTLYSASHDRSLRAWNVDEMAFVEALFGHQAEINAIDCLYRERAVTCSMDRTVRYWKIPEESQLVLQGLHSASLDCLKMMDEVHFLTGGQDGALSLWHTSKKKPFSVLRAAHGGEWISSVSALPNSDLAATGSSDGFVRFWQIDLDSRKIAAPAGRLAMPGFVNGLAFGNSGRVMVAGVGTEHRLGSWQRIREGGNRLRILRIPSLEDESEREEQEEESEEGQSESDEEEEEEA